MKFKLGNFPYYNTHGMITLKMSAKFQFHFDTLLKCCLCVAVLPNGEEQST